MKPFSAALVAVAALASTAAAADTVRVAARTIERDGVTVHFPAVTYEPPAPSAAPVTVVCARMASDAVGAAVDAKRDLVAETEHRVVFRDPTDATRLLKLYRPDQYEPLRIAKLIQRDLGVQALLESLGLRVAAIDPAPRLIAHGVERQQFVAGKGLDAVYPQGYQMGTDPAVDRVLAAVAPVDHALRSIVSMQSRLLFTNTVDCYDDRPLGVDLGHCYGNIFIETADGQPIFVDW